MRPIFLAFALSVLPIPARAQAPTCGERAAITARLAAAFGESQQAAGIVGPKQVLEVWANVDTGSWTALTSDHAGRSCLIASGEGWSLAPAPPTPQGVDG